MSSDIDQLKSLATLNHTANALNRAVDVQGVLTGVLGELTRRMGLETAWISLKKSADQGHNPGSDFVLAAHHNLPPALQVDNTKVWSVGCECQRLSSEGRLTEAYNAVHCSRLAGASGDRRGLNVHASVPLRAGDRILGILNVAGPDWSSFRPKALALLTAVGSQLGIALERAQLFDQLKDSRVREQSALLELSNQLLSHPDLNGLMDRLVEEVKRLLQADACALLLPGEKPEVLDFRAASGWQVDPVAERRRVSADECAGPHLAMSSQQHHLVEDLYASDAKGQVPDWLRAEGFRGHAVLPLLVEGRAIGALMINHRQPRLLDENEVRLLSLMANQGALAIAQADLHQDRARRQRLEQELAVGRQIQLSLLPPAYPQVPGWEFAVHYQPARLVGGDFYDFVELPGESRRLGMVIADVTDKGVPAALFMALSRTVVRSAALSGRGPAAALARANALILEDSRSDFFVTAFYAVLDPESGRMVYANAGHNRPLWRQAATGKLQALAGRGMILAAVEEIELEERWTDVAPGDLLLFYTDGVTEAMDADGQQFGEDRLREVVADGAASGAQQALSEIVSALSAFTGDAPQSDDLTLLVVRRSSTNA